MILIDPKLKVMKNQARFLLLLFFIIYVKKDMSTHSDNSASGNFDTDRCINLRIMAIKDERCI